MPRPTGLHATIGLLDPTCDQAVWWKEIYGSLDIPLKSFVSYRGNAPEGQEPEEFYDVDLDKLTDDQVEKVCQNIAERFQAPIDDVRAKLGEAHSLPIRAAIITSVAFDARLAL